MRQLLSLENPLFLLYQGRLRRWRRWNWALLALFWLAALGSESLAEGLMLGLCSFAAVPLILGLVAIPACLRSVSEHVGELLVSGISSRSLVDTGAAYMLRCWWRGVPWVLAATAVATTSADPWLAVLPPICWLMALPMVLFSSYTGMAGLLMSSWRPSVKSIGQGLVLYVFLCLPLGLSTMLIRSHPVPGLVLVASFYAGVLLFSGWYCRQRTLRWVEQGGGRLGEVGGAVIAEPACAAHRPRGRWAHVGDLHPLLYRYHRSRKSWRGTPLWFWCSVVLGLVGALISALAFSGGVVFVVYAAAVLVALSNLSQVGCIQRELGGSNYDTTLSSFSPRSLVDGLALVRLQPRLLEAALVLGPPLAVLSCTAPMPQALQALWLFAALGLAWLLVDTYACVTSALWLLRRGWFSLLPLAFPIQGYAMLFLSLSTVVLGQCLLWGAGDTNPSHWMLSGYLAAGGLSFAALGVRALALRLARR